MTWNKIGSFLKKFKDLKPPKKFAQDEIIKIIQNVSGVFVCPPDIEQRGGIVYIKTKNSIRKNEIFINKEKILKKLSQKLRLSAPKEIRF
jgi:hypothetical protein